MTLKQAITSLLVTGIIAGGLYEGTVEDKRPDIVFENEKVSKRTEVSKVIKIDESGFVAVVMSRPVHYKDPIDNSLKTIDTGFHERPLLTALFSEYELKVDAGNYVAYFDKGMMGRYRAESPDGSRWIEFNPLFGENADLSIDVKPKWNGVKETITLKNENAPTELRWLFKTKGMEHSKPKAWDAALNPVPIATKTVGDTLFYIVETKDVVYPVMVDPSAIFVDSDPLTGYSNIGGATFAAARDARAGTFVDGNVVSGIYFNVSYVMYRGHITIPTVSVPSTATIDSAKLTVYYTALTGIDQTFYLVAGGYQDSLAYPATWCDDFPGFTVGDVHTITALANGVGTDVVSPPDTVKFSFNADGLAAIAKADTTCFTILMNQDISNGFIASSYSWFEDDSMYLLIYYTEAPPGLTINGVANTTKLNGVTFAKVNGVSY